MIKNPFYILVVTNRRDQVIDVMSYANFGIAKGQRTRRRRNGYYDAKLFQATYALGCLVATEIEV